MARGVFTFQRKFTAKTAAFVCLQLQAPAKGGLRLVEAWIDTNLVADESFECAISEVSSVATVTTAVAADVQPHSIGRDDSDIQLGTTASGYDSTGGTLAPVWRRNQGGIIGFHWPAIPETFMDLAEDDVMALEILEVAFTSMDIIAGMTFIEN